jgi:hypothetical protein
MGTAQRVDRGMNWIVADRPTAVGGHHEMIATKQPFATCGKLPA